MTENKPKKTQRMCETCVSFPDNNSSVCLIGVHMKRIRDKDGDYYHFVAGCPHYAVDMLAWGGYR